MIGNGESNFKIEKYVYNDLLIDFRKEIKDGRLRTGDKILSEQKLAELYNLSRVSVRNALKKLEEEGLIKPIERVGYFVNPPVKIKNNDISLTINEKDRSMLDISTIPGTGIARLSAYELAHFRKTNSLINLGKIIEQEKDNSFIEDCFPSLLNRCLGKGAIYAIPLGFSPMFMIYNRDILDECGIEYHNSNWSWYDLLNMIKDVEIRDESGKLIRRWGRPPSPVLFTWQAGGEFFNEAMDIYSFNSEKAYQGLCLYRDLCEKGFSFESNMDCELGDDINFDKGRSVFEFATIFSLKKKTSNFPIGKAPMPYMNNSRNWVFMTSLAIRADSKTPEKDWKMIKELLSLESQKKDYLKGLHYPASIKLANELLDDNTHDMNNRIFINALEDPRFIHCYEGEAGRLLHKYLLNDFNWPPTPIPTYQEVVNFVREFNLYGVGHRKPAKRPDIYTGSPLMQF